MDIQAIGKTSFLIIVSNDELPENFTSEAATDIYKKALGEKGREPNNNACLEVYEGKDEVMIFVRFASNDTYAIGFDSFEDLLPAIELCPNMCGSQLVFDGERYILLLTAWEGEPVPDEIFEFGERLSINSELLPWLREQSKVLISEKAIETLANVF